MAKKYWLKKTCGIYKITNKLNGMCYVGQSIDICGRWKAHISNKTSLVGISIQTEGVDNFIFEVLEECDKDILNEREIYWIACFNCIHPLGYNKSLGGGAVCEHTSETKRKISESNKGKTLSEETKLKLSESVKKTMTPERREEIGARHRGKKAPQTPEHTEKIAATHRGRKRSEETRRKISEAAKKRKSKTKVE